MLAFLIFKNVRIYLFFQYVCVHEYTHSLEITCMACVLKSEDSFQKSPLPFQYINSANWTHILSFSSKYLHAPRHLFSPLQHNLLTRFHGICCQQVHVALSRGLLKETMAKALAARTDYVTFVSSDHTSLGIWVGSHLHKNCVCPPTYYATCGPLQRSIQISSKFSPVLSRNLPRWSHWLSSIFLAFSS